MQLAGGPLSASAYGSGGLLILFLVLFAETGLLIGFFLPGDTLLLLIGDYTNGGKDHHLNFGSAMAVGITGAFIGAQVGYVLGRRVGPAVFDTPSRQKKLERTHRLLQRLGEGRSCVAARFIPLARTFMNPALGATGMSAPRFTLWNIVGALLWIPSVLFLGRLVGSHFPLDKIVVGVVIVSLLVPLVEHLRHRRAAKQG